MVSSAAPSRIGGGGEGGNWFERRVWIPAWLEALSTLKFFVGCSDHDAEKKNEKNICCLDCCSSICTHCLPSHAFHRLVQVRRYVYRDVVRLEDLDKLIDCSNVQSYTINGSKVVFLKKRVQARQLRWSANICTSCRRCLQVPYMHCSLLCKVDHVLRQTNDLSPYLRSRDSIRLGFGFLPHDHEAEAEAQAEETNQSAALEGDGSSEDSESGSVPAFGRKKRANTAEAFDVMVVSMSRRKGIPHRSPMC